MRATIASLFAVLGAGDAGDAEARRHDRVRNVGLDDSLDRALDGVDAADVALDLDVPGG